MKLNHLLALLSGIVFVLTACSPQTVSRTPATLGYTTLSHRELLALPRPKGKILVSVYSFRDQSGQYKYHPTATSFSTAVTQGGTSMLIQALRDSGWFIPVEREGLNDLLTERKIIRAKLGTKDENELPKLLHAPLMIEGSVVSYETNVLTGGIGVKFYGIGGSTQFQKDQVAIYLRAVNVNSGEIVNSVSATKSILSQSLQGGVYRFVEYNRLLEVEAGYSTNEPPQMCVLDAIEKAVTSMVIEGIVNRQWELENPEEINSPVIQNYLQEKQKAIEASSGSLVTTVTGIQTAP